MLKTVCHCWPLLSSLLPSRPWYGMSSVSGVQACDAAPSSQCRPYRLAFHCSPPMARHHVPAVTSGGCCPGLRTLVFSSGCPLPARLGSLLPFPSPTSPLGCKALLGSHGFQGAIWTAAVLYADFKSQPASSLSSSAPLHKGWSYEPAQRSSHGKTNSNGWIRAGSKGTVTGLSLLRLRKHRRRVPD